MNSAWTNRGATLSEMKVFLGLGSNMGERRDNLHKAIEAIDGLPCTIVEAVSGIVETEAEGKWDAVSESGPGKFLNCCVRIDTSVSPHRLLKMIKKIEADLGRPAGVIRRDGSGGRIYSDRPIDIDILLYGRRRIDTPALQIPHPRMFERDFVMRPLREIAVKLPENVAKQQRKQIKIKIERNDTGRTF